MGVEGEEGVGEAGRMLSVSLVWAVVEEEERECECMFLEGGRGGCWCLWPNAQQMSAQVYRAQ